MRSAPPIVPGMPLRNSRPPSAWSRAVRATLRSSAPAPASTSLPSTAMLVNPAHQAHHDAFDAAVAHQQVGAHAQNRNSDIARQVVQERCEVRHVGRPEQDLGITARAEPGLRTERRIGRQSAARLGQPVDQVGMGCRNRHHAAVPGP
jgi:hypothetical protein